MPGSARSGRTGPERTPSVSTEHDQDTTRRTRAREVGLFRYGLIQDALDPALSTKQRGRLVRSIAEGTHPGPFGAPVRVSRASLDRWIRAYRAGGFTALVPAPRRLTPQIPAEVLELAAEHLQELQVPELAGAGLGEPRVEGLQHPAQFQRAQRRGQGVVVDDRCAHEVPFRWVSWRGRGGRGVVVAWVRGDAVALVAGPARTTVWATALTRRPRCCSAGLRCRCRGWWWPGPRCLGWWRWAGG